MVGCVSDKAPDVFIIGGGVFGCMTAIALADRGFKVLLAELQYDILQGASKNNARRVHYGYHYPRDLETAVQSRDSYDAFVKKFSECITDGFSNYYFVADELSKVSPEQYLEFCKNAGLAYEIVTQDEMPLKIKKCSLGVKVNEVVYNHDLFRDQIREAFRERKGIQVKTNTDVDEIHCDSDGFTIVLDSGEIIACDAVINCTYTNINRFDTMVGLTPPNRQYEYTVMPMVETDFDKIGISIMDGPFPCIMPYGGKDLSLLYHVKHSVISTEVTDQVNPDWLKPETSPFRDVDKAVLFEHFRDVCSEYIPAIGDTRLAGFLEGPRMVLAHHDDDDARPSLINSQKEGRYITIFSGKVDHSIKIADDVASILQESL